MSRKATLRALTFTIDMMEKHDAVTISCSDYLITMLKNARDLIREKPVKATRHNKYWGICEDCGGHFRAFMLIEKKARFCPNCGRRLEWNEQGSDPEEDVHHHPEK